MAVIKSTQSPPVLTPFSIRDMEVQAQSLLLRARRAAELLLAEAQREGELIKAQAKTDGFAEGKQEGLQKGLEEGKRTGHDAAIMDVKPQFLQTWAALTAAVEQLDAARNDLEAEGITEVVKLASAIARRVTKRQATIDPQVLIENLKEAMKLAVHAVDVHIVIHPQQRAMLMAELPRLKMYWPTVKHVELIEEESVGMGGCRIITRNGEVDAAIDQQLDRVISDISGKA